MKLKQYNIDICAFPNEKRKTREIISLRTFAPVSLQKKMNEGDYAGSNKLLSKVCKIT